MLMMEVVLVCFQCLILSIIYVSSLYVWKSNHERDHPKIIIRRFVSVLVVNVFSPIYLLFCLDHQNLETHTLWELMGIRSKGLLEATCLPLILTIVIFSGPLVVDINKETCGPLSSRDYWLSNFKDLIWLRNIIVAPLSEEITYRSCMIPLLSQYFEPIAVVFICPIFFGTAHFNHFMELVKGGLHWRKALLISCFQFLYTTMFGAYSTFLLLRTGHLISPVLAHMFCNVMGVPNFQKLSNYEGIMKIIIIVIWILGISLWIIFLMPLTEPHIYHNTIYWTHNQSSKVPKIGIL